MIELLPGRRMSTFDAQTVLSSRPLHPMMAEDIGTLLEDDQRIRRNVVGTLEHVYRSDLNGAPIVLADFVSDRRSLGTVTTIFVHGPQIDEIEHLFSNGREIAVEVSYRADDESLLAIDAIAKTAGVHMPLRPLTDREMAAQREVRLTVDQLMAVQISYLSPELEQHGWYGVERLPAELRTVRLGEDDGDPVLAVDATWTLTTFAEVVTLAQDYRVQQRYGQAEALALTLESLRKRGLVSASPQTPESIKAQLIAAGEVPDPDGLWPFERELDRERWYTDLSFDPDTGTLYIQPSFEG